MYIKYENTLMNVYIYLNSPRFMNRPSRCLHTDQILPKLPAGLPWTLCGQIYPVLRSN